MSYRYMRILVMFDLPVETLPQRRSYNRFRKFLIHSGFLMMQESVYCKLVPNSTAADLLVDSIRDNKPEEGLVQVLRITEKQYARIECIIGENQSDVINDDKRLLVL